jgi:putative nucleotidyltransferase with HDIG domain
LGFETTRNVAITVGMKQLVQTKSNADSDSAQLINGLWKRSIRVAALAFIMAKKLTRLNPDAAMIGGLLHDIGKFYILNRANAFSEIFSDKQALWDVIDRWHLSIGAAILDSWDISADVQAAVLEHRELERTHKGPPDLTDVVMAADVVDALHQLDRERVTDWNKLPPGLVRLNLDLPAVTALLAETKEELDLIFQALS